MPRLGNCPLNRLQGRANGHGYPSHRGNLPFRTPRRSHRHSRSRENPDPSRLTGCPHDSSSSKDETEERRNRSGDTPVPANPVSHGIFCLTSVLQDREGSRPLCRALQVETLPGRALSPRAQTMDRESRSLESCPSSQRLSFLKSWSCVLGEAAPPGRPWPAKAGRWKVVPARNDFPFSNHGPASLGEAAPPPPSNFVSVQPIKQRRTSSTP